MSALLAMRPTHLDRSRAVALAFAAAFAAASRHAVMARVSLKPQDRLRIPVRSRARNRSLNNKGEHAVADAQPHHPTRPLLS
jgi:hypothetical protein